MRNTLKAGLAAVAALALVALGAPLAASAHTPNASLNCQVAHVNLTSYDQAATATVVLDGVTLHEGTFGGHYVDTWQTTGGNTEHHLIVQVKSFDQVNDQGASPYDFSFDQTTSGCYTAPPKAEVTGSVSFADGSCIDGVRVGNSAEVTAVSGVRYSYTLNGGAPNPLPSQSYDDGAISAGTYLVTAESSDPAHYVYVGTATWAHTFAAVPTECAPVVVVPEQPADIVTSTSSEATDCDAETVTTTTVTTTTGSAYYAGTNTWVRTTPVDVTTTATRDATAEECPVVVPPTEEPPVVVPPVVEPPVVDVPVSNVPVASVDRLAYTGSDSGALTAAVVAGILALLLGAGAIVASRTRTPRYRRTPSE